MKFKLLITILCSLNIFNTMPFETLNINKNNFEIIYELKEEGIDPNTYLIQIEDISTLKDFWTNNSVNIRELPSINSKKITTLKTNTPIKKIKDLENGWSQILYKDKIYFINSKYLSENKMKENNTSSFVSISNGTNINIVGNCKYIELINKYTTYVPQNILDHLLNNGWKIYLTTEKLGEKHYYDPNISIQGITLYNELKIEIEDREKAVKNALIHEIGHALDGIYFNSYSTKEDFINIYNKESKNIKNLPGVNKDDLASPMEYFAESFKQFILNKESLKNVAPETYFYMENFITLF